MSTEQTPVETNPATEPAVETQPNEPAGNPQLEAALRAKKVAEDALDATKSELARLKRSNMSETERIESLQKELEEQAKSFRVSQASLAAEKVFVNAGLGKDDYSEVLGYIASESLEQSETAATAFVEVLNRKIEAAKKGEREAVLKETPLPPSGGKPGETDPFLEGLKNPYMKG
jgi:hypothetical protein